MNRLAFPPVFLVIDAIGAVLFGVGVAALVTDLSGVLPILGDRDVAGAFTGVGLAAMVFSGLKIVLHLRTARSRG
jgi:hypothetical protein